MLRMKDDPNFFQVFFNHLSNFKCEEIIIGGDFNAVLDVEKDKRGGLAKECLKSDLRFLGKSWFD